MLTARTAHRAIGIDLGTANTIAVTARGGMVFDQPSVCCFQGYDTAPALYLGWRRHAQLCRSDNQNQLKIVRPLKNGVLSDMSAARELLHFVNQAIGGQRRFGRLAYPHRYSQRMLRKANAAPCSAPRLMPALAGPNWCRSRCSRRSAWGWTSTNRAAG